MIKKAALVLTVTVLILAMLPTASAIDTLARNGTKTTVGHFRIFTPDTNDLTNGKPLVVFMASGEQGDLEGVIAYVNKYGLYDELDLNLMCVSFTKSYALTGWPPVAEELADYLKTKYEKQPFELIIDCVGGGGYGGCCLAQELTERGIIPRELNLGDGAVPELVTSERIRSIAKNGTQVNLYAAGASAGRLSVNSVKLAEELRGTERFRGIVISNARQAEVLPKAISEYGLHNKYTCWDVLKLQRYKASNGTVVNYCVYLPETVNSAEKLPVLIYFHGVRDIIGKLRGLGQLIRTGQITPKGIVVLPQAVRETADADFHTKQYQDAVIELAKKISGKYNGDLNRLSVAGHSDGGSTVYQIVNGHPGVFAACAPISGIGSTGEGIRQTYLWAFQGAKDYWVKPANGLRVALKCEASGCRAMHFLYENEGHEIQTMVFLDTFTDETGQNVKLIDWLMSKTLTR